MCDVLLIPKTWCKTAAALLVLWKCLENPVTDLDPPFARYCTNAK